MRRSIFLLFTLVFVLGLSAHGQVFPRHAGDNSVKPKGLLITILTRKRQREFLEKNRPDLLPEFKNDVSEVAHRTAYDFSNYFKYCPVYFFIDTNSDKIAMGEFEGILLDSSLNPVKNSVIKPGDKDFYIAHYGNPIPQPDSLRSARLHDLGGAVEESSDDPSALFREKLLVTDYKFDLLSTYTGPRTNFSRSFRPQTMTPREYRAYRRRIIYNSKRWFIDYSPCAFSYDHTLRRYFRK